MAQTIHHKFRKVLKWGFGILTLLLLSLLAIPSIFNDVISNEIKKGINANLESELQFKDSEISFFNHFPSLTFSFKDVNLTSAIPFETDSLLTAKELGFGVNVFKLIFSDDVVINGTFLTDGHITLIKDQFGRTNYDVYKTTDSVVAEKDTTASRFNIDLRRVKIKNTTVLYRDDALGVSVVTNGLDYNGRGGLDDGKLALGSNLDITSVAIDFDGIKYLNGNKLKAKSFTIYDTENLSIELDENTIALNDLKINFHGALSLFEDGLAYDLLFNTENGTLEKVVSALPPKYTTWSQSVTLKGDVDASLHLTGYSGTVPDSSKLERTDIKVAITDGTIRHNDAQEAIEHLNVAFQGDFNSEALHLNLDRLDFELDNEITKGSMIAKGTADSLYIKSHLKSNLNLDILNQTLQLPDLAFQGVLATDLTIDGVYAPLTSKLPKTKGLFTLSHGALQTSGHAEPIKDIALDAIIINEGDTYAESILTINALNFSFLGNLFTSEAFFKNFDQPKYHIKGQGTIDFTSLNQVIALPFLISNGQLNADLNLNGQLNHPQAASRNSGTLDLKNIELKTSVLPYPVVVKEGRFLFLNDQMAFSNLSVQHQSSAVVMDGYFTNYIDYALHSKGVLRGDLELKSPKIDITEFFPTQDVLTSPSDSLSVPHTIENVVSGVMQVPKDLDLALQIKIDTLQYNSLTITALNGHLGLKDQGLFLKDSQLEMVDGTAQLDGFYQPTSTKDALFSMDLKADHLNIEKGYNSMSLFKELAPAAAQASGIASIDYSLTGTLDANMTPVMPSLKGQGTLKVHNVKFDGYKLLGKVSEKSGFEALNNPKISEITIKSTVNNNVLEIERFKFKVSPFRLRAEGQTTFDGDLSLKMRIGLPPLGLIGIPVVIEGNSDDFDVKLGKKSKDLATEDTSEDSYSQDELNRLSTQKDSIRSTTSKQAINKLQDDIKQVTADSLQTKH